MPTFQALRRKADVQHKSHGSYSLGTVNHTYHSGNSSRANFSDASRQPTLQADLSKDNSLASTMLTIFSHIHTLQTATQPGGDRTGLEQKDGPRQSEMRTLEVSGAWDQLAQPVPSNPGRATGGCSPDSPPTNDPQHSFLVSNTRCRGLLSAGLETAIPAAAEVGHLIFHSWVTSNLGRAVASQKVSRELSLCYTFQDLPP